MAATRAEVERGLESLLLRERDAGLFTHAYVAAGLLADDAPRFRAALAADGRDVFDLASLTKAVATVPLVFAAVQRGEANLDGTVGAWLGTERAASLGLAPELQRLSVRSVLRHETGLPAWRNFWVCHLGVDLDADLVDRAGRWQRLVEGLNRAAVASATQTQGLGAPRQVYSDLGFLLLGLLLEATSDRDVGALFADFCAKELGLAALPLGYGPVLAAREKTFAAKAVPTAVCPVRRRLLVGDVHDENCASLGGLAGHAGLFGTGDALATFLVALAKSTVGRSLLSANASARPATSPADPSQDSLCGWRLGNGPSTAPFCGGRAMGHPGFTGTAFWVCPETQAYAIFLTNRVASGRTSSLAAIAAARRDVFSLLAAALST